MSRACGCPDNAIVFVHEQRHAEWHKEIAPLTRADAVTLEAAYGRPSVAEWTYVDEQFTAARLKADALAALRARAVS